MPRKKETAPGRKSRKVKNNEAVKPPKNVTKIETVVNVGTTEPEKTPEVKKEVINDKVEAKLEDQAKIEELKSELDKLSENEDQEEIEAKEPIKISVTREGRPGIFIPEIESLVSWINSKNFETIHHAFAVNHNSLGANWSVENAIERIRVADKVGILMPEVSGGNLGHALAVVYQNKLNIMDIGVVTEEDLDIKE